MRVFSLFCFLLLTAAHLFAQPLTVAGGRRRVRIPVEIRHNLVLVRVSINDSPPVLFILDTGVKNTLLTEPVLLSLIPIDTSGMLPAQVRGLGSPEPVAATRFRNVKMRLGDCSLNACAELPAADLLVLPEGAISYGNLFGMPVAGIIGSEVFSRFVVAISYTESHIDLVQQAHFRAKNKGWQRLPILLKNGKPYVEATLTLPDHSQVRRVFLLDSGSSSAVLYSDPAAPLPERMLRTVIGTGIGGVMEGGLCRYPALHLGSLLLAQPMVGLPDSFDIALLPRKQGYYANLGADILSRFRVVFDYSRGEVWLRPNQAFHKPFAYNYSGLDVTHTAPGPSPVVVVRVRAGSPAAEAGLQPGDTLLQIQHLEIANMDIQEVFSRLNPDPGRGLCVRFMRPGQPNSQRVCYRCRDDLRP